MGGRILTKAQRDGRGKLRIIFVLNLAMEKIEHEKVKEGFCAVWDFLTKSGHMDRNVFML